jgi:hypothetical protein
VRDLVAAEGDGLDGPHARPGRCLAVGEQAGRQVHGQHGEGLLVEDLHHLAGEPTERAAEAGAKERVDDEGRRHMLEQVLHRRRPVDDLKARRPATGDAERVGGADVRGCGEGRVAAQSVWRGQRHHDHRLAPTDEVAGGRPAVAPVVARAGEHDDGAAVCSAGGALGDRAGGVIHQREAGDAKLLDRAAIGLAGLGGGEQTKHVS